MGFLKTVCVMVSRIFSRFKDVLRYKVAGVRTEATFRSYGISEEGKVAKFEMVKVFSNDRTRPEHGFVGGSPSVIPKATCLSYGMLGGPVAHAV